MWKAADKLLAFRTRNTDVVDLAFHGMPEAEAARMDKSCVQRVLTSRHAMRICECICILLKLKMMVISLYVSAIWPSRRGQMVFVGLESMKNMGIGLCFFGLSFEANLLLVLASLPVRAIT